MSCVNIISLIITLDVSFVNGSQERQASTLHALQTMIISMRGLRLTKDVRVLGSNQLTSTVRNDSVLMKGGGENHKWPEHKSEVDLIPRGSFKYEYSKLSVVSMALKRPC